MLQTTDLRPYLDELWARLPAFADSAAGLPAEERGSIEWLAAAGAFWWRAREDAELSLEHAAEVLKCSVNEVRLMEYGIVSPSTFGPHRLHHYSGRLGDHDLYA